MTYHIKRPEVLQRTTVQLPASKSISNRLLLLNALSYSPYPIQNLSDSDDTAVMLSAMQSQNNVFDVGAAGTSMRFLTAFLSKIVGEWVVTGSERMKQRPIRILVDALKQLGARIEYEEHEGYPPLRIWGSALKGTTLELPGNVSSQYISALMMIAPEVEGGIQIKLTGKIISKPYLEMTLQLMDQFGARGFWKGDVITIPQAAYHPVPCTVESDWSAASYWYEMVALSPSSEITLTGLDKKSTQGDSAVAVLFESLGVKTRFHAAGTTLTQTGKPAHQFSFNFTNQPDLAQTLAVTCCLLDVPFRFTGLESLKIKETDRIAALVAELQKLGFVLATNHADNLIWDGTRCAVQPAAPIETYKDHRMAMAFAPAALQIGSIAIDDPMVVTKSYPRFWDHLKQVGFEVDQPA